MLSLGHWHFHILFYLPSTLFALLFTYLSLTVDVTSSGKTSLLSLQAGLGSLLCAFVWPHQHLHLTLLCLLSVSPTKVPWELRIYLILSLLLYLVTHYLGCESRINPHERGLIRIPHSVLLSPSSVCARGFACIVSFNHPNSTMNWVINHLQHEGTEV